MTAVEMSVQSPANPSRIHPTAKMTSPRANGKNNPAQNILPANIANNAARVAKPRPVHIMRLLPLRQLIISLSL